MTTEERSGMIPFAPTLPVVSSFVQHILVPLSANTVMQPLCSVIHCMVTSLVTISCLLVFFLCHFLFKDYLFYFKCSVKYSVRINCSLHDNT